MFNCQHHLLTTFHPAEQTRQHGDLFSLFKHIITSDDVRVKRGKPAPDLFEVALASFDDPLVASLHPGQVLVFEDSPNGAEAAKAAGMPCVLVPDPRIDPDATRAATVVLSSLKEFVPEDFGLRPFLD